MNERDVASNVSTENGFQKSWWQQLRVIDRLARCGVAKNCRPPGAGARTITASSVPEREEGAEMEAANPASPALAQFGAG